jgi:hypothetical protein
MSQSMSSVLGVLLFVEWVLADDALSESRPGSSGLPRIGMSWLWMIQVVVCVADGVTLVQWQRGFANR